MESVIKEILDTKTKVDKNLNVVPTIFRRRQTHDILFAFFKIKAFKRLKPTRSNTSLQRASPSNKPKGELLRFIERRMLKTAFASFVRGVEMKRRYLLPIKRFKKNVNRCLFIAFRALKSLDTTYKAILKLKERHIKQFKSSRVPSSTHRNQKLLQSAKLICACIKVFNRCSFGFYKEGFDLIVMKIFNFDPPSYHDLDAYHKILLEEKVR